MPTTSPHIKSGSTECRPTILTATLAQFNGLPGTGNPGFDNPLVYTPGDNEWTDCHRFALGKVPDADLPAIAPAKLAELRSTFFATPRSQGRTTMPLTTQSGYPENARWKQGDVVFVTIDQPGSNNNFCSPSQNTTVCDEGGEATAHNIANVRAHGRGRQSRQQPQRVAVERRFAALEARPCARRPLSTPLATGQVRWRISTSGGWSTSLDSSATS
jgi:hypothetical protein